jgi:hypothetical protein
VEKARIAPQQSGDEGRNHDQGAAHQQDQRQHAGQLFHQPVEFHGRSPVDGRIARVRTLSERVWPLHIGPK